jgi:SAM-dependent methyltransferase
MPDYWSGLARAYAALGPPLRPDDADIAHMESAVAGWAARHPGRRIHALLLGVTPRIAEMEWPPGTSLFAADNSLPMVRMVWPGNVPRARMALCADWCALPLRESTCDVVIGDGSFSCLRYPHGFRALAGQARRVLRDDGMLILRAYVQPVEQERADNVLADLRRGAIASFHWFKFRLLMALQQSTSQGIAVDAVYRYWASQSIDEAALIAQTGWEAEAVRMMDLYRGKDTIHSFSTMAELQSVLAEHFAESAISAPPRAIEECCPILVAAPRAHPRPMRRGMGAAACPK